VTTDLENLETDGIKNWSWKSEANMIYIGEI